jgi:hypothetical protein
MMPSTNVSSSRVVRLCCRWRGASRADTLPLVASLAGLDSKRSDSKLPAHGSLDEVLDHARKNRFRGLGVIKPYSPPTSGRKSRNYTPKPQVAVGCGAMGGGMDFDQDESRYA